MWCALLGPPVVGVRPGGLTTRKENMHSMLIPHPSLNEKPDLARKMSLQMRRDYFMEKAANTTDPEKADFWLTEAARAELKLERMETK